MHKVQTLNNISIVGLERLPRDKYEIASEMSTPDAIILRSYKMHDMAIPDSVRAIGRAGSGTNNIPVAKMSEMGIPVFNAPGANANAVKELVLAGMIMAARNIGQAWQYTTGLEGNDAELGKMVEAGKKQFVGYELIGKTLGVIGLGAIGAQVANAAALLGMKVVGYDPTLTVASAWQLSADVAQGNGVDDVLSQSDFVTFHVPLTNDTKDMINGSRFAVMKPGVVLMNFARDGIVNDEAMVEALNDGKAHAYICDFPSNVLKGHDKVITLPHLGASTKEAEDNCAVMVADQLKDYLENGNILNSVNFPNVSSRRAGHRLTIANANVPNMVGQISTILADAGLNIIDLINKSRGELAYTVIDVEAAVSSDTEQAIKAIDGVLMVRVIPA
ncbi:MAG: phosphoglycerate dehydrogenase [Methylococcales bacterium]|jgi:D-3-phosphoglycerate dehydrogenase / 2-oxoglutarate reductase|nr:phosphoglycerate dehydrogenase [Methylococcales bacterium]